MPRRNWSDWLGKGNAGIDFAQDFTQILAQCFSLLISVFGVLCERAVEYRLQARRCRARTRLIEWKRIFM